MSFWIGGRMKLTLFPRFCLSASWLVSIDPPMAWMTKVATVIPSASRLNSVYWESTRSVRPASSLTRSVACSGASSGAGLFCRVPLASLVVTMPLAITAEANGPPSSNR